VSQPVRRHFERGVLSSLQPYTPARDLEEHSKNTPAAGRLPPTQPAEDIGHYVEGPRDKSGGAKPDRAAKIRPTGHCSRETTSNGRPHHQDATWRTSQSRHVMDPRGSGRRRGRPTMTWRSIFKEDLVDRGIDWNSVRAVATNRSRWRTLAAHCLVKDRRI